MAMDVRQCFQSSEKWKGDRTLARDPISDKDVASLLLAGMSSPLVMMII